MKAAHHRSVRGWNRAAGAFLALATAGGLGCGARAGKPAESGTARMADTLAWLHERALEAPALNPYLNRRRADVIQAVIDHQTGAEAFRSRYALAEERLRAGQTREAIAVLQGLMKEPGVAGGVTAENRFIYDLLAIAYLRLGEQENCVNNPAANVCILPFVGAGRHALEEGAREAVTRYRDLLEHFPDDRGSQWLLNIAEMSLGGYPDRVPSRYLIPGLAPDPTRSFPRFPNIAAEVGVGAVGLAGGVDVEDFTGDGLLDILTTSSGVDGPMHLFVADGKGGYVDRADAAGLHGIVGGLNTVHADYDNDGDEDVVVVRGAWLGEGGAHPVSLLRNRGDGTFEDVTFAARLVSFHPSQVAAWADFNLDGFVDLFIGNESNMSNPVINPQGIKGTHPSELFLNNRDGTFTEVARQVGIDLNDFVKGATWIDVQNDGLPDLFVSVLGGANRLYLNRGGHSIAGWRFEEGAAAAGVQEPIFSFPTWSWDFDQDGWQDLLVLSYDLRHVNRVHEAVAREYLGLPVMIARDDVTDPVERSRLFRNRGDGTFADVTRAAGLDRVLFAMGSNYGDLDNDGWLDFYVGTGTPDFRAVVPNRMFRSVEGRRFEEVTLEGGFGHIQKGHATAFGDLDRDGDEDVYMVMGGAYEGDPFAKALFENPGWPKTRWISLELEGRTANRSAIGARVELVVAEPGGRTRTIRRRVGSTASFGSGPRQLHVGLGRAVAVQRVRIIWPDSARTTTTSTDLSVDRYYHIVQGAEPVELNRPPVPFRRSPATAEAPHHSMP